MIPLPRLPLPVSRLCLGSGSFGHIVSEPDTLALLDRFVALGGNFIDTARIYSDWVPGERSRSERIIGDWLRARGNRDRLVIATKGAHHRLDTPGVPRSSAAEIREDLDGSLRSLRIDTVDLYWMHRDDPSRPVEHFIDLLNGFVRDGKIRAFGASNWTIARLRAAQDYAARSGQIGFAASQPLWCLGCQQAKPSPIPGLAIFDGPAGRFHRETGLAVIPFTSQAHGFFSKLARPPAERPADLEQHLFHTPPNLAAGQIVVALATAKGVAPSAIVLAYLWSHAFPVVPIVGCHTIAQLEDSFAALPVRLAAAELQSLEEASQSGL